MDSTPLDICYSHPRLIQLIQQPQLEYQAAVNAADAAQTLVRDMKQALAQAETQLAQALAQIQRTIPAQQEHCQLVRKLQLMQRACWHQSLSDELSALILGKTSRYNARMMAVSCQLLRITANAAEPIKFETSPEPQTRITAGRLHTVCVSPSGRVVAWGLNQMGQLGVGDKEKRVVPTLVTGLLRTKSVVQVAAGNLHTACLTADGLVYTWGRGHQGWLGLGDTEDRVVPTLVRGGLEGRKVLQIAAGTNHTMCVTAEGAVFACGYNILGQLGVGDRENRLVPTLLRGELQNELVVQVAAGYGHTIFVTNNGLVFACGDNNVGQLGVGDAPISLVPKLAVGLVEGKTAVCVAAGDRHTLCATADGSLFAWGANGTGQLGVGDKKDRQLATLVTGLQDRQVVHLAAGSCHTICTTADGFVFTWGSGDCGRLGLGDDYSNKLTPALVRGELQNRAVVQVAAGQKHSMCVIENDPVYTWGSNVGGEISGVANADLPIPIRVIDFSVE